VSRPSQFVEKRILVTGASGFIGSHLCRSLLDCGAEVHGISRRPREENFGMRWWQGDVADNATVRELFSSICPHYVFHLASYVSGSRDLGSVLPAFHNNLASTVNILTVATEQGCERIILAGSLEEPDHGEVPAIPSSPYAAAKWASSAYARMFHALYQTPVVTACLFMVYGPGQQDIKKLVPYVILSLLRDESPRLSSGERKIDWIFVDDAVEGLLAMAGYGDIDGKTIELGSGTSVTVRDVVGCIANIIGTKKDLLFGSLSDRPLERVRVANVLDTRMRIGWIPQTSLEEGLQRTIDWYRRHIIGSKGETLSGRTGSS
jgi:UDP-glucose 4-epimerase